MVVALQVVVGWCVLSTVVAFGLGPLLHGMKQLADRHETPQVSSDRSAA